MAKNFKPKANTCMHGWRRIISCKGLGKRVCRRLTTLKRGFNGLGINSGKDLIIINNKSIIIKLSFE